MWGFSIWPRQQPSGDVASVKLVKFLIRWTRWFCFKQLEEGGPLLPAELLRARERLWTPSQPLLQGQTCSYLGSSPRDCCFLSS